MLQAQEDLNSERLARHVAIPAVLRVQICLGTQSMIGSEKCKAQKSSVFDPSDADPSDAPRFGQHLHMDTCINSRRLNLG